MLCDTVFGFCFFFFFKQKTAYEIGWCDWSSDVCSSDLGASGMDSDRLFASWELHSPRVAALAAGQDFPLGEPEEVIEIPADFTTLLKSDPDVAKREQLRVRAEFLEFLGAGLVCRAFDRKAARPRYLFYRG